MFVIFSLLNFSDARSPAALLPSLWSNSLRHFLNDPVVRVVRDPLVWGPVGTVLGVYLFVRGFLLLRRKRLLMNTPRSSVRGAAIGPVEVNGHAAGPYTLVSPLSLSDCYYYRVVITYLSYKQKQYKVVDEAAPLFLDDDTGKVMIDPRGAEIHFAASATWDSDILPDYLRHFLIRHEMMNLNSVAAVAEFCIRPGDTMFVFGTLQENPWAADARRRARDPAERIGPGFLSELAADVQRRKAFESLDPATPSGASTVAERDFDLYPPVILAKGSGVFVISQESARELVGSLAWQATLYIWGGPALALFSVFSLLQRLVTQR